MLAALSGIDSFKQKSSLKSWVYSIALNKSKDFIKYKLRKKRAGKIVVLFKSEEENHPTFELVNFVHPGVQLEQKEDMDFLFKAINSLPENQKTALILAKIDHRSQKEIAGIMGVSPKAAESLLSRAKANLKTNLSLEGILIYKKNERS